MKVSAQQLEEYSKQMINEINAMKEALAVANNQIDATQDAFKGQAADQVRARFYELKPKFNDFYSAMEGYAQFLTKTANAYKQSEQSIQSAAKDSLTSGYGA